MAILIEEGGKGHDVQQADLPRVKPKVFGQGSRTALDKIKAIEKIPIPRQRSDSDPFVELLGRSNFPSCKAPLIRKRWCSKRNRSAIVASPFVI